MNLANRGFGPSLSWPSLMWARAWIGMTAVSGFMIVLFSVHNAAQAGDNYIATQFHAPGLRGSAGETLKMLVGSNIDAHHDEEHGDAEHGDAKHGEAEHGGAEHGDGADHHGTEQSAHKSGNYAQVNCGTYCRTVSDDRIDEKYEECLGPCFKCSQVAIREQASAHKPGDAEIARQSFEQCWANIPTFGAFKISK